MEKFQAIIRFDKKQDEICTVLGMKDNGEYMLDRQGAKALIIQDIESFITFPNPLVHQRWHCAFLIADCEYEVVYVRRLDIGGVNIWGLF